MQGGPLRKLFRSRYGPYILGNPLVPRTTDINSIPVINPANGQKLTDVATTDTSQVTEAIDVAQNVFDTGVWSRSSSNNRSTVLSRLAELLASRVGRFAELESLQTGRAIREMRMQLSRLPEWLDYYSALIRTHQGFVAPTQGQLLNYVTRIPLGVVAQITPFNHPLLIAIKKIAPALAAGNSVIVKPSELAPVSVLEFAELATEAGVPPGVLQVLPGTGVGTGADIISNKLIRKVDITAGTKTGREIGRTVGSNLAHYTAELGGKAPIVVFNDADKQGAVNGAAFAAFVASGQTCVSGTRLIVQDDIYEPFMDAFLEKVRNITQRIGNPMNPLSMMGSVISSQALSRISSMVSSRSSGTILFGGERMTGKSSLDGYDLSQGNFFSPTVISEINREDPLWHDEVFGPVIVVKRFKDDLEGVLLANSSIYGLGAGIWTTDLSRAHRIAAAINSGLVWINCHHRNDPSSPWGGMKESGIGRENGVEAFEQYSQSKSTIVNCAPTDESRDKDDWFAEEMRDNKRYG